MVRPGLPQHLQRTLIPDVAQGLDGRPLQHRACQAFWVSLHSGWIDLAQLTGQNQFGQFPQPAFDSKILEIPEGPQCACLFRNGAAQQATGQEFPGIATGKVRFPDQVTQVLVTQFSVPAFPAGEYSLLDP